MSVWEVLLSGFVGAVLGGGIAGYFSLKATEKAHDQAKELERTRQKELIDGLLQGLHDEIETLWESYMEGVGHDLVALQENQPLLTYYPVTQEYFSVYVGNAILIGRISDTELRKSVVSTYTMARGLIDSYRLNNELFQKFEHWDSMYKQTGQEVYKQHATDFYGRLIAYAKKLKKGHEQLMVSKTQTLRMLQRKGVLVESVKT